MRKEPHRRKFYRVIPVLLSGILGGLLCSSAAADGFTLYEVEGELHARSWTLGGGIGTVEGLDSDLARIAGMDNGVAVIEYTENHYLTPNVSSAFNGSLNLMNNFSIVQAAVGQRWSTVPFPKVFLRPWIGLYATLNFLEDDRDLKEQPTGSEEEDVWEGLGVGLAAAFGVTMKVNRSMALEIVAKGDAMRLFGRLEKGEIFGDSFITRGVYVRLMFISK